MSEQLPVEAREWNYPKTIAVTKCKLLLPTVVLILCNSVQSQAGFWRKLDSLQTLFPKPKLPHTRTWSYTQVFEYMFNNLHTFTPHLTFT